MALFPPTDSQDDGDGASPAAGHHGSLGDASSAAVVNFKNDSVLDPGVFMELTGLVQPTGIATRAFSPPGFAEGSLLAPFRNTATVEGPLGNQSMRPLAAWLPTSSSRVQQLVPERISVECAGDWLTDRLIDDLPAVATAASDSWFADLGNDLWHDGRGTDLAG